MANPPFMSPKGGIKPHDRFGVQSNRSEVLFVDYIAEHLTPGGRAAVIVPEGVIFQSAGAYKTLRKMLVEKYLYAVVSLPAGVFNPYAGVKTSILFLDKALAKKSESVLFLKVENDGFGLGAQRKEIAGSDLPAALEALRSFRKSPQITRINADKGLVVAKTKIAESGEYNLTGERYRVTEKRGAQKWPMVRLGDVCELVRGITYTKNDEVSSDGYKVLRANNINVAFYTIDLTDVKQISKTVKLDDRKKLYNGDIFICLASGSKQHIGKVALITTDMDCYFGGFMGAVRVNDKIIPPFLFEFLRAPKFNHYLEATIAGANINNLSSSILYDFEIPLPPLDVQREIVAEVAEYQRVIDGARQVVDNWKPRIEADEGWAMVKLGDENFFSVESGGTPDSQNKKYWDGDIHWITLVDLPQDDYITDIKDTKRKITQEGLKNSSAKLIPANSVIVSTRATIGRIGINKLPICTNQGFKNIIIKDFNKIDPVFLAFMVERLVPAMDLLASGGTFKEISKKSFCSLEIPVPSIEVQREIVARIEAERRVVDGCRELIGGYTEKVKCAINRVWG